MAWAAAGPGDLVLSVDWVWAADVRRTELHAMEARGVVMVTVGDETVLRDAIPVTGRERIVLFGAPAACTLELHRQRGQSWNRDPVRLLDPRWLNKNWVRLSQRSIGAVVSRYAH